MKFFNPSTLMINTNYIIRHIKMSYNYYDDFLYYSLRLFILTTTLTVGSINISRTQVKYE